MTETGNRYGEYVDLNLIKFTKKCMRHKLNSLALKIFQNIIPFSLSSRLFCISGGIGFIKPKKNGNVTIETNLKAKEKII